MGPGIENVVAAVDEDLNAATVELLNSVDAQLETLHIPFDRAIVLEDAREGVFELVRLLFDTGDQFSDIAIALDLSISTELPE